MARLFTAASSHVVRMAARPHLESMLFGPITFVAVVRRTTNLGWHTITAFLTSGGSSVRSWALRGDDNKMQIYDGATASNALTATITVADGWCLFACAKGAGVITPRFHRFVYGTGDWIQEDGHASQGDGSGIGAGGFVDIGRWQTGDFFNGDIQAVMMLKRALADGEIKQLIEGNWSLWEPDWHVEFPPEDNPAHARDIGRARAVQTAVTGTTRSASRGAPGFRHSADGRRR